MNFDRRQFVVASVVSWCAGCVKLPMKEQDGFGITKVSLTMEESDLGKLKTAQEAKIPYPAKVDFGGEALRGEIKNTGRSTLDAFKKSYEFKFIDGGSYRGWKSIRLNAQASDLSSLKSLIGFEAFAAFGLLTPAIEPIALYLNQDYLGLYYLIEPVDEHFFARHRVPLRSLFKAKFGNSDFSNNSLTNFDQSYDVEYGLKEAAELRGLIEMVNDPKVAIGKIAAVLNVDNYLRYHAVATVLNHFDGYSNNFFIIDQVDGPMFFVPWDLDRIFETDNPEHSYEKGTSLWGTNQLSVRLFQDENLKKDYIAKLRQLLQHLASAQTLKASCELYAQRIKAAYEADRVLRAKGSLQEQQQKLQNNIDTWIAALSADLAILP